VDSKGRRAGEQEVSVGITLQCSESVTQYIFKSISIKSSIFCQYHGGGTSLAHHGI
jgi:hypothetical protein